MIRWRLGQPPPVLTVKEVADLLRCHESKVYRMLEAGELPGFKVGGHWRVSLHLLHDWIESATLRNTRKRG